MQPKCTILSWNINGLRSSKRNLKDLLDTLDADIICLQETKITRDVLEEPLAIVDGYSSYFSFSKKRSGYSGVATFCKDHVSPSHCQEGLSGLLGGDLVEGGGGTAALPCSWSSDDLKELDNEGRTIITQHLFQNKNNTVETITIINVYCPRADHENAERNIFKMKFMELLRQRASAIRSTGSHVIVLGDINISHKRIDHCDPEDSERNCGKSFEDRPSRRFLDSFILNTHSEAEEEETTPSSSCKSEDLSLDNYTIDDLDEYTVPNYTNFKVIDTFRHFNPTTEKAFTCWNTFVNARSTNYGTRIDYIFVNEEFLNYIENSTVEQDVMGSDHCPVKMVSLINVTPPDNLPLLCTKFYPEFQGKQSNIKSFFNKKSDDINKEVILKIDRKENTFKRKSDIFSDKNSKTKTKQVKLSSFFSCKKKENAEDVVSNTNENIEKNVTPTDCEISKYIEERSQSLNADKKAWSFLMNTPKPAPLCPGHGEPCALRTVRKKGQNFNKQFYACARGAGKKDDPNAQCNFFKWFGK